MSEVSDRYSVIADSFAERLSAVAGDRWETPTPSTEWTVKELVVHVISTHRRIMSTLDGRQPADVDTELDLRPQWSGARAEVTSALACDDASKVVTMRRPGGFAAKIDPAAGADDQTKLLNFCGRPTTGARTGSGSRWASSS
jgi:Mycothiol maleylpyruvate isomerase N-terminal domain